MIGRKLSHYEITGRLGAGGMGEVYLARDLTLDRPVAVKVLPAEVSGDPSRLERLTREAKALAALDHPNIVTVHSVEEDDGIHFLTMAFVQGKSLGELIPETGMPVEQLLEIGLPLADALRAAHDHGIVHRDLKPANIMVDSEDRPRVLDFGLARMTATRVAPDVSTQKMAEPITLDGAVMGTIPYMSPEQAEGKPVDSRSDIFSFGIVLYEMATGQRPFNGESAASLISSILRDTPRPLAEVRPELPPGLQRIVDRCLQKFPEDRFQSSAEVRDELAEVRRELHEGKVFASRSESGTPRSRRQWLMVGSFALAIAFAIVFALSRFPGTNEPRPIEAAQNSPAPVTQPKRIVVLPFENLGSPDDEYFAAGMTDEITSRLSAVGELGVISRKSAQHYVGTNKTIPEIAEELGVDYVLEGTVRWARDGEQGSRVRITPRLIDVTADTQIWADVFDRDFVDIFDVQSGIALEVVRHLGVTLLGEEERSAIDSQPTRNLEAYQAFLRGNYYVFGPNEDYENLRRGVEGYQEAVELDPEFALAWTYLSRAHSRVCHFGYENAERERQLARTALDHAERLAPGDPQTYLSRAFFRYWGFKDYEAALEQIQLASQKLPRSAEIPYTRALIERRLNRLQEALDDLKQAAALDPQNHTIPREIAYTLLYLRRYPEMMTAVETSLAQRPTDNDIEAWEPWMLWLWKGRESLAEARAVIDGLSLDRTTPAVQFVTFRQLVYEGKPKDAVASLGSIRGEWIRLSLLALPKSLLAAQAFELSGDAQAARRAYEEGLRELLQEIEGRPDDFRLPGSLGIAYAGLGQSDKAIASAKRGVEMLPLSKDALWAHRPVLDLAQVYTMLGRKEDAIEQLDLALGMPAWFSVPMLELDPRWAALRDHAKYQELVDRHKG